MAVREYIGARYVPKFMGTWSATTAYEALSIVDDGLGTSYTSKKPVPVGTVLTDTEYWAVTGSTSGAILDLQNRVTFLEGEYANVKYYGATGDGLTDDSDAFDAAFATGKNVYIPEGTYKLTREVELLSHTIIFGNGTLIDDVTFSGKKGLLNIDNKEHIIIDGISIIGQGATSGSYTNGCEIYVYNSKDITIQNVYIEEVLKCYSICFETSDHCYVENAHIYRYTQAGISCINVCNDVVIQNCALIDCTGKSSGNTYPIMLNGYDYPISSLQPVGNNLKAIGNTIDNPTTGAYWEGIDAHGGSNIVISNNIINNCFIGIGLAGNVYFPASDVSITGNILKAGSLGVAANNNNSGINASYITNGVISNNIIDGFDKWSTLTSPVPAGIYIPNCDNLIVKDNEIMNCGQGSGHNAIQIQSSTHIDISGNYLHDNNVSAECRWLGNTDKLYYHDNILRDSAIICDGVTTSTNDPIDIISFDNMPLVRTENGSNFVPQYATSGTISSVTGGTRGMTIAQRDPVSGVPMGFVCQTGASTGVPATWIPLPNIP